MRKIDGQTMILGATVLGSVALIVYVFFFNGNNHTNGQVAQVQRQGALTLKDIPFNGERSYAFLKQVCDLGPRVSGSAAMTKQQELLTKHFEGLGTKVVRQEFRARHPLTGKDVPMTNLIVQWQPEAKQRVLLCAHYDTRPIPDQDPDRRNHREGLFVGANDGGSGVAVLAELGQQMAKLKTNLGVDFVFFDGEELVYTGDRDPYFLGSEYFARQYVAEPPGYRYKWAVLLDMVGDANLEIFFERNSFSWRETRPLVQEIWKTAKDLGVTEFVARAGHEVRDDHLALRNIAKIPACDIIDFDYPGGGVNYWHTVADTPDKCSALSLAKVGWVLAEWLKRAK